jgi:hypothetical protein
MHTGYNKPPAQLTYDEWVEIGNRMKFVYNEVQSLLSDKRLQARMTRKQMSGFWKAYSAAGYMKDQTEEAMFRDISKNYKETRPLLDIFYGDAPAKEPEKRDGV